MHYMLIVHVKPKVKTKVKTKVKHSDRGRKVYAERIGDTDRRVYASHSQPASDSISCNIFIISLFFSLINYKL